MAVARRGGFHLYIPKIELIEIADVGHGEKGKIGAGNWNFIEQIVNEAISEMKWAHRKTGFFFLFCFGQESSNPAFDKSIRDPSRHDY